jgi:glycosyltransferase involved in cell wall biosynthesis
MLLPDSETTQVIMISYFRPNDFRRSVESVLNNTVCPFHLSIIDNSHGGLDKELDEAETDPRVTTYRNEANLGKGAGVNRWYRKITEGSSVDHFVSIDSDILVPPKWLLGLKRALLEVRKVMRAGIIAPAIVNRRGRSWTDQVASGRLNMHQMGHFKETKFYPGLYYNRYTAGPLFLIDRPFFEQAGLYYDKQLYGADDGMLCRAAASAERFIGIDSHVEVKHLDGDSTEGYLDWKRRNIKRDVDQRGHWD